MSGYPVNTWIFGKLPSHGDFVSRGLQPQQRLVLDAWLSQEMESAMQHLASEFDQRYVAAPPWRFANCEADGEYRAGALCLSVDSVGRRFPLVASCSTKDADRTATLAAHCEDCIYQAFAEQLDADGLLHLLNGNDKVAVADRIEWGWWTEGGEGFAPNRLAGRRPEGLIVTMLNGGWL